MHDWATLTHEQYVSRLQSALPIVRCKYCPHNKNQFVHNNFTGDIICRGCGTVACTEQLANSTLVKGTADIYWDPKEKPDKPPETVDEGGYLRRHHFSQYLLVFTGKSVGIDEKIFDNHIWPQACLYRRSMNYRTMKEMTNDDIREVLHMEIRSTDVDCMKQKIKRLADRKQFGLRRKTIYDMLCSREDPKYVPFFMSNGTACVLRMCFDKLSRLFEKMRHVPECDGRPECHKHFGCRYGFLNVYFLLKNLLLLVSPYEYVKLARFIPNMSEKKDGAQTGILNKMYAKLNWPTVLYEQLRTTYKDVVNKDFY